LYACRNASQYLILSSDGVQATNCNKIPIILAKNMDILALAAFELGRHVNCVALPKSLRFRPPLGKNWTIVNYTKSYAGIELLPISGIPMPVLSATINKTI